MADFSFNIAKGRIAELHHRVKVNDGPGANAALIAVVIGRATAGTQPATDDNMRDADTLAALLTVVVAAGGKEVTNSGYGRKTTTDSTKWDTTAFTMADFNTIDAAGSPANTNNCDVEDITWVTVAAGDVWTDLIICYDSDTTGGTDSGIVPLTLHDFSIPSPDGSDIVAQIPTLGYFRAQT